MAKLMGGIKEIDSKEESWPLSEGDLASCQVLKDSFPCIATEEEIKWKQRYRLVLLREGDNNTKFFHNFASFRNRRTRFLLSWMEVSYLVLSSHNLASH